MRTAVRVLAAYGAFTVAALVVGAALASVWVAVFLGAAGAAMAGGIAYGYWAGRAAKRARP